VGDDGDGHGGGGDGGGHNSGEGGHSRTSASALAAATAEEAERMARSCVLAKFLGFLLFSPQWELIHSSALGASA